LIHVYRIAKTSYIKDLTGAGARLYGGRWNHKGTPLIYTSQTRSLATVEFLVHLSLPHAPADISMATIEIPDDVRPEVIALHSLPSNWRKKPAPSELADLGTTWAQAKRSLLLRVPSAVVEHEFNILINPAHPDMPRVAVVNVEKLTINDRPLH